MKGYPFKQKKKSVPNNCVDKPAHFGKSVEENIFFNWFIND